MKGLQFIHFKNNAIISHYDMNDVYSTLLGFYL